MYFMFCLVFLIFLVDSITLKHKSENEHPFTTDDDDDDNDNTNKIHDKFMLIPSLGYEMNDKPGTFTLTLNGWYYEPLTPGKFKTFVGLTFQATLAFLDQSEKFTKEDKEERLGPFFVHDVPNHNIELQLSPSISEIVTTDENGRFHKEILIDSLEGLNIRGQKIKYMAFDATNDDIEEKSDGIIYLMKIAKHRACSIISDIDDTIKISEVPFKNKLTVNTFKKDFRAVPGMSDRYRSWRSSHQCLIHYVSAMPSQLYYVTQKFLDKEKFPRGSFHMRHLKLVDKEKMTLLNQIIDFAKKVASQKHKLTVIKHILDRAPTTQEFVMVGDSGELDPEIYGEIARAYPKRIKMIFIRLVNGGNNTNNRFENAFKDVSRDKWGTFSDADELPEKLYEDNDLIHQNNADNDDDNDNDLNSSTSGISLSFYIIPISFILFFMIIDV